MTHWIHENLEIIQFVYGLSFFSLGLVISVQPWMYSRYRFAKELWALAAFAFIHAFADWGLLFIPLHALPDESRLIAVLWGLRTMIGAISFGFLLHFGVKLISARWPWRWKLESWVAPLLTLGWLVAFFIFPVVQEEAGVRQWYWISEVWSRYLLGLPAGVTTAVGLLAQRDELKRDHLHSQVRSLNVSGLFFALYGLMAGLVVRKQPFWPASVINGEAFFALVGIPVEVVRTLASMGTSFATVRLMSIFTAETAHRLYQSEEERTIFRERERIARDLHDGMLQTLYGVGLGLRELETRMPPEASELTPTLTNLTRELGSAIGDLRQSITNLREDGLPAIGLATAAQECVNQVTRLSHLQISMRTEGFTDSAVPISEMVRSHVLAFLREGLFNVVRHAQAVQAVVVLALQEDTIVLRISDDGIGFNPTTAHQQGSHFGLRNMAERAAQLDGTFRVDSAPGQGTRLLFHIPVPMRGGAAS